MNNRHYYYKGARVQSNFKKNIRTASFRLRDYRRYKWV